MQPIEVIWYGDQRGSWCQAIVEWLTAEYIHVQHGGTISSGGSIVVVKADHVKDIQEFNRFVAGLKWVLVIVTANEDGTWQWNQFEHPRSLVWLQTPHRTQHAHRFIPWGWTPGCMEAKNGPKIWDWSFAGQITHSRREEFLRVANELSPLKRIVVTSKGFSQGVSQEQYYKILSVTKIAPCPSGPITVDSMRVCEALQLGATPIVDAASPTGLYHEYWDRVFPGHPLRVAYNWKVLPTMIPSMLEEWDEYPAVVRIWWASWKASLKMSLQQDLHDLGAL
jgi:hypothetical protein